MQAAKKEGTPRCYTLVMGCCSTGTCSLKEGSCGCGSGACSCKADCNCKKADVRVQPQLNGGSSLFYAVGLVVLAAAGVAAAHAYKNK